MRWSENETYKFVKLYMSYTYLWNPDHSYYKLNNKRQIAYREIISKFFDTTGLKLSVAELKIKIKNLRSTYLQELAKIKRRSSSDCTYQPSIKWFAEWHRCFSTMKKPEETSFDDQQENTDEPCPEVWVSQNDEHEADPFPEADDDYKLLILKPEPDAGMKQEPEKYKIKKKKLKRTLSTDFSDKTFRSSIDSGSESITKDDEFDIYGKYIATQLRKLGLHKALRVQLAIQSLVSEARIADLSSK